MAEAWLIGHLPTLGGELLFHRHAGGEANEASKIIALYNANASIGSD